MLCFAEITDSSMDSIDSAHDRVRFYRFEVDVRARQVRKHGIRIRLQQQPFQILVLLLERPGEVVTREALQKAIWPADTFVDFDVGLAAAVHKLRQALGDSAEEPRFIETLPKRGFRFIAPVETVPVKKEGSPDSRVLVEPADAPAPPQPQHLHRRTGSNRKRFLYRISAVAVLVAAVSSAVWWRIRTKPHVYVIAVLPLKNLSAEPNSDYFSDSLTDEIIRKLSLIEGLEVRSRTSSFAFKDKPRNLAEVSKALGVNLVLEGSVLCSGEKLRIDVNVVRVPDDTTIWSERFDRPLADIVAIQDEISRSIVNELRLKQIGGQRRYNTKFETYDLYLKAESLAMKPLDQGKSHQAIELFERVIASDGEFAPAYAGIGEIYARLRNPRGYSPDALQKMREMAKKAIDLDPLLAESWATMGIANASDLMWGDAERAFRQSIQLNPNLSQVRRDFALFVLVPEGKLEEAVQQERKALELDPLAIDRGVQLGLILTLTGGYDEALALTRQSFEAKPMSVGGQVYGHALMLKGRYDDAMRAFGMQGGISRGYLGCVYAKTGRRAEAEQIAAEDDVAKGRHQVLIYAGLGDTDRLFAALNALADNDDYIVDLYPFYPELGFVRRDPRMRELRRKRNLPPLQ